MATTSSSLLTAEEFMALHASRGNSELVRGEVVELSPAMPLHGRVCGRIAFLLEEYGSRTSYGFMLCNDTAIVTERNPDTVRGADVSFYSHGRLQENQLTSDLPRIPPDLTVEVLSPGNRSSEIMLKVGEYLKAGVLMVWVVQPERRTVAIYQRSDAMPLLLHETDVIENLSELPDFRCQVSQLFP